MARIFVFLTLLAILLFTQIGMASAAPMCSFTFTASNQTQNMSAGSCGEASITFQQGVSNSGLVCSGATIGGTSTVTLLGYNKGVYLRNCTVDNPSVTLANHASLYVIGSDNATVNPVMEGNDSNVTVAHYLRINVFEPYGYNSTLFGSRAAGFSYIFPLMNRTFRFSNSELLASEFVNSSFQAAFSELSQSIPFGAYNVSASNIPGNYVNVSYGKIKGSKVFALPDYTIYRNRTVTYNPYEVDYTFLGYDQLVTFRLNITRNLNLTPIYIEPLFPPFNFDILPDNGTHTENIRYVVAVPPQDTEWNLSAYIYRYTPQEFSTNPVSQGVGPHSVLIREFSLPGSAPDSILNGTRFYFVNYTAAVELGINSSIMTMQGYIPGKGSVIEDSTTPSFSFGLGYCALAYNLTVPMSELTVNRPGTYNMVNALLPLAEPALPQLVNAACTTGVVVTGGNIDINCDGGTINDTRVGIAVRNSTNVEISNCRIIGNGLQIINSSGISLLNLTFVPSGTRAFGVQMKDVNGVAFRGLDIGNGYSSIFSAVSSAGTPFSQGIEVYNLSICGQGNVSAVRHFAYIYGVNNTCSSGAVSAVLSVANSDLGLALLTVALIVVYAYVFLIRKRGRGPAFRKPRRRSA